MKARINNTHDKPVMMTPEEQQPARNLAIMICDANEAAHRALGGVCEIIQLVTGRPYVDTDEISSRADLDSGGDGLWEIQNETDAVLRQVNEATAFLRGQVER